MSYRESTPIAIKRMSIPIRNSWRWVVAHAACGFIQGFPISASSSRTPVAETAGAKSQWACLLGAMYVMILIAWAPDLLESLPMAALGAIVISACLKQMTGRIVRIYRLRHSELIPTIVCFLGVVLLGVIEGYLLRSASHAGVCLAGLAPLCCGARTCRRTEGVPRCRATSRKRSRFLDSFSFVGMLRCFSPTLLSSMIGYSMRY